MRKYAVLLGMGLTAVYGYVGQVAVASLDPAPKRPAPAASARAKVLDAVWYGGTLPPVVVEATKAGSGKNTVVRGLIDARPSVRCFQASQPARHRAAT